jgi:hypothetical protein
VRKGREPCRAGEAGERGIRNCRVPAGDRTSGPIRPSLGKCTVVVPAGEGARKKNARRERTIHHAISFLFMLRFFEQANQCKIREQIYTP